jgi:hypothetical protein
MCFVSRKARAAGTDSQRCEERPLEEWRELSAYVLLGDPGAGKSHSLKTECDAAKGMWVTPQQIQEELAPDIPAGTTVFVDGLDEMRGSTTTGNALGAVARYLKKNGNPRFRLSCREADWRGDADIQLLRNVNPDIKELHLTPLSDEDIDSILKVKAPRQGADANAFIEDARKQGVYELMRNPLLLDLLVDSVAEDGLLPFSRMAIYEAACRKLAQEHSQNHNAKQALQPGVVDETLNDAGTLCALLLMSGKSGIARDGLEHADCVSLTNLPRELKLHDPKRVIASKLFTIDGHRAIPRHRTISEFLAGRALSERLKHGMPLRRLMILMLGEDGQPVEAMRGLCAWLAVHAQGAHRTHLVSLDPLGFVLNGDASALNHTERVELLRSLSQVSEQNRWFRSSNWVAHPFGPLATPDMAQEFENALANPDRTLSHLAFMDCLLDALKHAPQPIPGLAAPLSRWVEEHQPAFSLQTTAYDAWRRHAPIDTQDRQILSWLDKLEKQEIKDPEDRLLGHILQEAYPRVVRADVIRFLRPSKNDRLIAEFSTFWGYYFLKQTPIELLPALANEWVTRFPNGFPVEWKLGFSEMPVKLLTLLLAHHGDNFPAEVVYRWLGIGLDENDFDHYSNKDTEELAGWLEKRPELMKAIATLGYASLQPDERGYTAYWDAEIRLYRATRPADWLRWQMQFATESNDDKLVKWLLQGVANAVVSQPAGFDIPTLDEMEAWVASLLPRHPEAEVWLRSAWTMDLKHWQAERKQRETKHRAEQAHAREQRRKAFAPHLAAWPGKPMPEPMLQRIAMAWNKMFIDVQGATPLEHVADLLGADERDALKALDALDAVLDRSDLPNTETILANDSEGKKTAASMPFLLAAERACERNPVAWRNWNEPLQQTLSAFWLTYGMGDEPYWFKTLCEDKPQLIAPIFVAYAKGKLRKKGHQVITSLWALNKETGRHSLALLVIPELLETFPAKASPEARDILNRDLLPFLQQLPPEQALSIVRKKLTLKGMDVGQKISWLVALLNFEPQAATQLVDVVSGNQRRAVMLGEALHEQEAPQKQVNALPASCIQTLIELLAPITPREPDWPGGIVTTEKRREDTVTALLRNLGSNPSAEAASTLQALLSNSETKTWRLELEYQIQAQRLQRREASFKSAKPEEVARLLVNGPPVHIADLQALIISHMLQLGLSLRGNPTNLLRQFRRDDGTPREEEECRDILLRMLETELRQQKVDIQPESRAASEKRMDLRATVFSPAGQRLTLPIEAKKDNHKAVWTAWRDQLQALYTNDPDSQGYGIYWIFWFGVSTKASPEGFKPRTANELEAALQSRIPEADRHKLQVVVTDLS